MEHVGVMDCGAYSAKYAVVSRKSRHMSDVRVAEAPAVVAPAQPLRTASAHWSQQLPSLVSRFAEDGAELTLLVLLDVDVPQHEREKLLHLCFETIGCQRVSLCYAAAASLFAVGQVSGVTVDVGYRGVRITPVTRGVVETTHAFSSHAVGAAQADEWLRTSLAPITGGSLDTPAALTAVKAHISALDETAASAVASEETATATSTEDVKLPDGETVTLTVPHGASRLMAQRLLTSSYVSVPHAFRECCEGVAIAHGEVYPWLLTGGSAAAPHVRATLADAVRLSAVCTDATESRAKNPSQAAVEGGVILSQLGTFKGMCVTAENYAEEGPQRCVHMKVVDYR